MAKRQFQNNRKYTCHNCGSEDHFIRNCPNPINQQVRRGSSSTSFTGYMQKGDSSEDNSFDIFCMMKQHEIERGCKLHMIVDTGATKTVIGEITLKDMLKDFSTNQRNHIMQKQESDLSGTAKFKFGDGKTVAAQKVVHIPIQLAGRIVKLKT